MNLTFHKGTTVILSFGGVDSEFLVSAAEANQTYIEASNSTRTLFNNSLVKNTFVVGRSLANFSFTFYVESSGSVTRRLLQWMGFFEDSEDSYSLGLDDSTINFGTVYFKSEGTSYKVDKALVKEIQVSLNYKGILEITVTGEGNNLTTDTAPTVTINESQRSYRDEFFNSSLTVYGFNNINAVTLTITKEIRWTKQNDMFQSIYYYDSPYIESLAAGGTITLYKKDDTLTTSNTSINIEYGSFEIILPYCNTTERWVMQDIHKKAVDYKLLPSQSPINVIFN